MLHVAGFYRKNENCAGFFVVLPEYCGVVARIYSIFGKQSGSLPHSNSNFVKNYQQPYVFAEFFNISYYGEKAILNKSPELNFGHSVVPFFHSNRSDLRLFETQDQKVYLKNNDGSLSEFDLPVIPFFNSENNYSEGQLDNFKKLRMTRINYSIEVILPQRIFLLRSVLNEDIIFTGKKIFSKKLSSFDWFNMARVIDFSEHETLLKFIDFIEAYDFGVNIFEA